MKKAEPKGYRRWAFTDYAFNAADSEIFNHKYVNQLTYGWEFCPQTGALHKQGRIELFNPHPRSVVQAIFKNDELHCDRENYEQKHKEYVQKDGEVVNLGPKHKPGQGSRTDIHSAMEDVKAGATLKDIIINHPSVAMKYPAGLKMAMEELAEEPEFNPNLKVYVYWGNSGTGKSHQAYCKNDRKEVYRLTKKEWVSTFFNGYRKHKILLLDDFDGSWMKFTDFKTLCDGYATKVNLKGRWVYSGWDTIIITSNHSPAEWYKNATVSKQEKIQLARRLNTGGVTYVERRIECEHLRDTEVGPGS